MIMHRSRLRRDSWALPLAVACLLGVWIVGRAPAPLDAKYSRGGRRTSGAKEALDLWAAQRAYPNRVIPSAGYAQAFDDSRARLASALDREMVAPWQPIGPQNIGGRTLAVAFNPQDPQTVWAGAASGGLWRSTTGGAGADAWDRVLTGFPVLGVSSITFAPGDSMTLYIGTGEVYGYQNAAPGVVDRTTRGSYGIGILKSTDGGATWTKSLDWSYQQQRGVASLAMHPSDPNTLYAGTSEGTYKTTDGGVTWNRVHDVLMSMQVIIDPIEPQRVYAACGDMGSPDPGIYRSEDGGQSWLRLGGGLPASWSGKVWLDIYAAHPEVIYASVANDFNGLGLYRSTDHGGSWVRVTSQDYAQYQGWYSHWVSVDPVDSTRVLTGGIDVWRSTQGGANLSRVSFWNHWYFGNVPPGGPEGPPDYVHADQHCVVRHPDDPSTIYLGTDGGVFRSFDGGQTFEGVNGGYQSTQFYNGFTSALSVADLAMGGMQDNATAIYEGTVGWRRVIGGDGAWTAIHPLTPSTMFGSYQNLGLRRSFNSGVTWQGATSGMGSDAAAFVAPYVMSYGMPDVLYAGKTKVYKTTNGGSSWFATNGNLALDGDRLLALGISWFDPNVVYAGTAPTDGSRMHVFMTENGGTSWTDVTGVLPDRWPSDLGVDPGNPDVAYVTLSGFGTSHLWRTTDRGGSWTDAGAGLPDVPTSAVTIDPDHSEIVYCGNDLGVYVSTDAGTTWSEFVDGMPPAMVYDLAVAELPRKLRVATHGCGAYERPLVVPGTGVAEQQPAAGGDGGAPGMAVHRVRQLPNVPNPFNPTTEVRFVLAAAGRVRITVADASGRRVATLLDGRRAAGVQAVTFDARGLASGVYVVQVEAAGERAARKVVLAQ